MHFLPGSQRWRPMAPRLGFDWGDLIGDVVGAGTDVWSSYQQQQAAEEARRAAEAQAAAQAQAARAAQERAEAERAAAARAEAEGTDEILGVKKDYLLYGAIGLGVIAVVAVVAFK